MYVTSTTRRTVRLLPATHYLRADAALINALDAVVEATVVEALGMFDRLRPNGYRQDHNPVRCACRAMRLNLPQHSACTSTAEHRDRRAIPMDLQGVSPAVRCASPAGHARGCWHGRPSSGSISAPRRSRSVDSIK